MTKSVKKRSNVQHLLVNGAKRTNKWPWVGGKLKKWHSLSRCTAANNKLQCLTMTKKKTKEGKRTPKWSPAHATVIKHGKHWLRYQTFSFWFLLGTNKELITVHRKMPLLTVSTDPFLAARRWNYASSALKIPCLCIWHDLLSWKASLFLY